jgi:hypothetical protein
MKNLTVEEINGLLHDEKFLTMLRDRSESKGDVSIFAIAVAMEARDAILAVATGKKSGIGYSLRLMKQAGAIHSYLEACEEDVTTYLPESNPSEASES